MKRWGKFGWNLGWLGEESDPVEGQDAPSDKARRARRRRRREAPEREPAESSPPSEERHPPEPDPVGVGLPHAPWPVKDFSYLGDRVWLVLGGGGIRGVAHAGVWQALTEADVPIAGMVGTSIGALVGGCIAGGMHWAELIQLGLDLRKEDIVRLNRGVIWVNGIREQSVFHGHVLREYIDRILPTRDWGALDVPLQVNAVDLSTGRTEWFGNGARTDLDLAEACYASSALAVLYPPARLEDQLLVDGGTNNALAIDRAAELGATGIIAIDVGSGAEADGEKALDDGLVAVHDRVFAIMAGRRRRAKVDEWTGAPLLYVRPSVDGYSAFAFDRVRFFLEEGYRAMRTVLEA